MDVHMAYGVVHACSIDWSLLTPTTDYSAHLENSSTSSFFPLTKSTYFSLNLVLFVRGRDWSLVGHKIETDSITQI